MPFSIKSDLVWILFVRALVAWEGVAVFMESHIFM